jgi:hypothetical protein
MKFHGDGLGATATAVRSHRGKECCPSICAHILPVRELENSLPISWYLDLYKDNPAVCKRIAALCRYIERVKIEAIPSDDNVINYLDLKRGLTVGQILAMPLEKRKAFLKFAQLVNAGAWNIEEVDNIDHNTIVHEGICETALVRAVQKIEGALYNRKEFKQKVMNSPNWVWLSELLLYVISYGLAPDRSIVSA